MLEELEPTVQGPIQSLDDILQRVAAGPGRLGPDIVFQLVQTLPPRPVQATLEVITQEVEAAFLVGIPHSVPALAHSDHTPPHPPPHLLQPTLRSRLPTP